MVSWTSESVRMDSGSPKKISCAIRKSGPREASWVIYRLGRRFSSENDKTTISAGVAVAVAARPRIVACYHILLHTLVQRSMADSPGAASEGCCQGEGCSRAAVALEVVYTTGTTRTRARIVTREEDAELMAESKNAPDAPAHSRTRPAPVDDEHAPVLNRAGEALCLRIVWPVRATTKLWVYAVRPSRANEPSQT